MRQTGRVNDRKVLPGFTLLEILVSISLFAVLLAVAGSSFFHTSNKYRLQRAIWEIHSKMNYTRFKAVFYGTKFRMFFDPHGYSIERYDQEADTWKREQGNIFERILVDANNNPIFHPEGTVSNLASITVSNAWGSYKITLAISGRIKTVKL